MASLAEIWNQGGQAIGGSVFSFRHVDHEIAVQYFQVEVSNEQRKYRIDLKFLDLVFSTTLR